MGRTAEDSVTIEAVKLNVVNMMSTRNTEYQWTRNVINACFESNLVENKEPQERTVNKTVSAKLLY